MNKRRYRPIIVGTNDAAWERQVKQEIETYLTALQSYPERFADDPCISFEQHLFSIAMARGCGADGDCLDAGAQDVA
jgi:hypothetical protein